MVQEAVPDGRTQDVVAQDSPPLPVRQVAGQDDAAPLVAPAYQLEEEGGGGSFDGT